MKKLRVFLTLVALSALPSVYANPPGGGGPGGGQDPDNDAPIDGGIGVLIAAGAAYGFKRLTRKK